MVYSDAVAVKHSAYEYDIGVLLTDYLELLVTLGKVIKFTHVANETFTRSWNVKRKNKAQGVRPGCPDYIIVTPSTVLFLELKREKGGVVSNAQKEWILSLQNRPGIQACVARGWLEVKNAVDTAIEA